MTYYYFRFCHVSGSRVTLPDTDIPDNAPSLDEVQRAIRRLKNGRAAGADDIPPELLEEAQLLLGDRATRNHAKDS